MMFAQRPTICPIGEGQGGGIEHLQHRQTLPATVDEQAAEAASDHAVDGKAHERCAEDLPRVMPEVACVFEDVDEAGADDAQRDGDRQDAQDVVASYAPLGGLTQEDPAADDDRQRHDHAVPAEGQRPQVADHRVDVDGHVAERDHAMSLPAKVRVQANGRDCQSCGAPESAAGGRVADALPPGRWSTCGS
jgi:hypothetical protein